MKHIRDLLMDCRIELRTLVRDFHKTELCKRIDDARDALLHSPGAAAPAAVSVEAADQIAQAWQASAEDLRLTAPAIYDLLAKKVAQRLAALPPPVSAPKTDTASVEGPSSGAPAEIATDQPGNSDVVAVTAVATVTETASAHSPTLNATLDDGHVPSQTVLTAIAASKRRFTEAQREWCVGEAMVRSGFSIDPEEFIARGDNEMARYILESGDLQN